MDGEIPSTSLEVGIRGKCEAVGREGGSIAADLAEGHLGHRQVNRHCQRWMRGGGFLRLKSGGVSLWN